MRVSLSEPHTICTRELGAEISVRLLVSCLYVSAVGLRMRIAGENVRVSTAPADSKACLHGDLIQILIQIGCVHMEANSNLSHVDYDPDSDLDSGPGARANVPQVIDDTVLIYAQVNKSWVRYREMTCFFPPWIFFLVLQCTCMHAHQLPVLH